MKLTTPARTAAAFVVVAGVLSAAPAQASQTGRTGGATAEAATAAAKKPLRAERRTDLDAVACGTSVDQLSGDAVAVTYYNCSGTALELAPTATASDGSGSVTYTSVCQEFQPGEAWFWEITSDLARRPTFIYSVTACA
jgi:hypothetical protein